MPPLAGGQPALNDSAQLLASGEIAMQYHRCGPSTLTPMFRFYFPASPAVRLALGLCLALITLSAHATDYVRARVYTRAGESFQLFVDGSPVGQSTSSHQLPALASGYHWLEFRFPNRRLPQGVTGYRTQAWFAPGFESVYELDAFPAGQRMKLTRIACTPLNGGYYNSSDYTNNTNTTTTTTTTTTGIPSGYDPATTGAPNCATMMQSNEVTDLINSLQSRDFESTKVSMAKQALDKATIMTDDIKRIVKVFEFESTRLDFAKFAYSRCCDQRNYLRLSDVFEFDSSVTELQRFTSGR